MTVNKTYEHNIHINLRIDIDAKIVSVSVECAHITNEFHLVQLYRMFYCFIILFYSQFLILEREEIDLVFLFARFDWHRETASTRNGVVLHHTLTVFAKY